MRPSTFFQKMENPMLLNNFCTYQLSLQLYKGCESVQAPGYVRDQLMRAALSSVLHIAEGAAKPTDKDRRRFYAIAYGSCREVQALIQVLGREELKSVADQLGACLYRLVHPR